MHSVSKLALGMALAIGGSFATYVAPAAAQIDAAFTKQEREALSSLKTAFDVNDFAGATNALVTAKSVASGNDAKYFVAQYQYQIGVRTNNFAMQAEGLEAMIASGRVSAQDLPALYSQLGAISYNYIRDYPRAERYIARQVELAPNDPSALANLARMKRDMKKPSEALTLIGRAISAQKASGQMVPENWYKMALDMAYTAKLAPQAAAIGQELVAAYPTQQNWRDTLLIYRELQPADPAAKLDAYRLLRASKSLSGERDYYEMAAALQAGGYPGEAKEVIREGVSARMVDASKTVAKDYLSKSNSRIAQDKAALAGLQTRAMASSTGTLALGAGDSLLGSGDYAKAASLYRAALEKGSIDANLANARLGMALALAGQKAEAESALRAVTGPRADLANYWLTWLARRS